MIKEFDLLSNKCKHGLPNKYKQGLQVIPFGVVNVSDRHTKRRFKRKLIEIKFKRQHMFQIVFKALV